MPRAPRRKMFDQPTSIQDTWNANQLTGARHINRHPEEEEEAQLVDVRDAH